MVEGAIRERPRGGHQVKISQAICTFFGQHTSPLAEPQSVEEEIQKTISVERLAQFCGGKANPIFFPVPRSDGIGQRDAYYHPAVDSSEEPFKWGMPDLDGLREYVFSFLCRLSLLLPMSYPGSSRWNSDGANLKSTNYCCQLFKR